jgi:hypothetical protein
VDDIHRDSSSQHREEVGSSPEVVLDRGRRWGGLAVARSFSAPIRSVVAISGGALVEGWGKTTSPHLGEGPRASGEAWETVAGRDDEGVRALFFLAMGKNCRGGDRRVLFIGLGVPVGEVQRLEPKSQLNRRIP